MSHNEWVRRIQTRSVYQANDLFEEVDIKECVAWFLPKWAYFVARSFLFDYGQRKTSFSLGYRTGLYLKPDEDQFDEIEEVISEALGGDIVCVDDLVVALGKIQSAIEVDCMTSGCEDVGSGGAGQKEVPETTLVDNGVDEPTGGAYESYEEYKNNKCGWANKIVDDIIADMLKVSTSTIVTWVAALLSIAFVTPIPFDDIFAIIGIGLSFVISGLIVGFAQGIITEINLKRDDFVCALYDAPTAGDARVDFLDVSTLPSLTKAFLGLWLKFDNLNRLFTKQAELEGDCSNCTECGICDLFLLFGSSGDGVNFSSTFDGTFHRLQVYMNTSEADTCTTISCDGETTFFLDSLTGHSPSATLDFQIDSCVAGSPTNVYQANVPWTVESGRTFSIFSSTSFSCVRGCP